MQINDNRESEKKQFALAKMLKSQIGITLNVMNKRVPCGLQPQLIRILLIITSTTAFRVNGKCVMNSDK